MNIFHFIIIHNTEISTTESFSHGLWNFRFCLNYISTGLFRFGFHFLFGSHSHCAAFFRFCLRDILVGICLVYLQGSTNILTYINISDINRENFKCSTGIESFAQH